MIYYLRISGSSSYDWCKMFGNQGIDSLFLDFWIPKLTGNLSVKISHSISRFIPRELFYFELEFESFRICQHDQKRKVLHSTQNNPSNAVSG